MTNYEQSPLSLEQRRADWSWLDAAMRATLVDGVTEEPPPMADDHAGDTA